MSKWGWLRILCFSYFFFAVEVGSLPAQTFTTLANLEFSSGPNSALVQGTDGNFYGTTSGFVFKITPAGTLTTLQDFGEANPTGLVLGTDGNFYGTTTYGGNGPCSTGYGHIPGCGTVFKITPGGTLTTFYSFCTVQVTSPSGIDCADGNWPDAPLVLGADGNFYGTTSGGGRSEQGTAFKISPGGSLTTLHSFCAGCLTDGDQPEAGLVQGTDGNFYGTTWEGGANGLGTIFKITPAGALTTLNSFAGGGPPSPTPPPNLGTPAGTY